MLSYVPKQSMLEDDKFDMSTGDARTIEMITHYNKSKRRVDVPGKMCVSYTLIVQVTCRRYPMVIFYSISWNNTNIIHNENNSNKISRYDLMK